MTIHACPCCGTDLDDEGFDLWCPSCQAAVSWQKAVIYDDPGDPDD